MSLRLATALPLLMHRLWRAVLQVLEQPVQTCPNSAIAQAFSYFMKRILAVSMAVGAIKESRTMSSCHEKWSAGHESQLGSCQEYNRFGQNEAGGLFRTIVTEGNQHEVNPKLVLQWRSLM